MNIPIEVKYVITKDNHLTEFTLIDLKALLKSCSVKPVRVSTRYRGQNEIQVEFAISGLEQDTKIVKLLLSKHYAIKTLL